MNLYEKNTNVHRKLSYSFTSTNKPLVNTTYRELIDEKAEICPEKVAFICRTSTSFKTLTFAEVKEKTSLLSQNLLHMGFKKGDRLGIAIGNCYELLLIVAACAYVGIIAVIMNVDYTQFEFEDILRKTDCTGLVVFDQKGSTNYIDILRNMCPELSTCHKSRFKSNTLPELKHIIVLCNSAPADDPTQYWDFKELENVKLSDVEIELPHLEAEDPGLINFSSGTTGVPKGMLHCYFAMINPVQLAGVNRDESKEDEIVCYSFAMLSQLLYILFCFPYYMNAKVLFPFYLGKTEESLESIQNFKCSQFFASPRILNEAFALSANYDLSSLRQVYSGGYFVPRQLMLEAFRAFDKLALFTVLFGSTEACADFSSHHFTKEFLESHSDCGLVGKPKPFMECKVVDEEKGEILELNQAGLLMVRSVFTMIGYWGNAEKTREVKQESGWLNTGDVVSMDPEGNLYFKSRHKDVIKIDTLSLYPLEVEENLNQHPNVAESCVFGVDLSDYETVVGAWIRLKDKSVLTTSDEILEYCKENFSSYKTPKFVKFVDNFARNANGKYLRTAMSKCYL